MQKHLILATAFLAGCASTPPPPAAPAPQSSAGVLVMAHGGSQHWNAAIEAAVAPLRKRVPVALAFGMADPSTMQAGLDSLADRGVTTVAVVRLFVSGESFRHQTEFFLGLRTDPPKRFTHHGAAAETAHPIPHSLVVRTHDDGVADFDGVSRILRDRAAAISTDPKKESVLILAHGTADNDENRDVIEAIRRRAAPLYEDGYRDVRVETLREDWSDKRAVAEERVRSYVERAGQEGRVLVLPFRIHGFGPYVDVLDGLDYVRGTGLLPHPLMEDWLQSTATTVLCTTPSGSHPTTRCDR